MKRAASLLRAAICVGAIGGAIYFAWDPTISAFDRPAIYDPSPLPFSSPAVLVSERDPLEPARPFRPLVLVFTVASVALLLVPLLVRRDP